MVHGCRSYNVLDRVGSSSCKDATNMIPAASCQCSYLLYMIFFLYSHLTIFCQFYSITWRADCFSSTQVMFSKLIALIYPSFPFTPPMSPLLLHFLLLNPIECWRTFSSACESRPFRGPHLDNQIKHHSSKGKTIFDLTSLFLLPLTLWTRVTVR